MKIIEGLKQVKSLRVKAQDLRAKVGSISAHMENNPPEYSDPKVQVKDWLQQHKDVIKEIENILLRVMKTNLITNVTIDLNGNQITKPIAAWIYRERELCDLDRESWLQLTDKGLKAVVDKNQKDPEKQISRVVFNFDAKERDNKINQYREEKVTINSTLEIVNATTELID